MLLWLTADARAVHEEVGCCLHPQWAWGSLSRHDILAEDCTVGCRWRVLYKLSSPMRWGIEEDKGMGLWQRKPQSNKTGWIQGWEVLDLSVKSKCCLCATIIVFGFQQYLSTKKPLCQKEQFSSNWFKLGFHMPIHLEGVHFLTESKRLQYLIPCYFSLQTRESNFKQFLECVVCCLLTITCLVIIVIWNMMDVFPSQNCFVHCLDLCSMQNLGI